jgi:hypothetical protein
MNSKGDEAVLSRDAEVAAGACRNKAGISKREILCQFAGFQP